MFPTLDSTIRLGVTGLARSGKTVFITSLIANLLDREFMPGLEAERDGRIEAVFISPPPDESAPRFKFEHYREMLDADPPKWPNETRNVSRFRLTFWLNRSGLAGSVLGRRTLHLDIVDYPGEWLQDLKLLNQTYYEWSEETLLAMDARKEAGNLVETLNAFDAAGPRDDGKIDKISTRFAQYLRAAFDAGYLDCTPGQVLVPGREEGTSRMTFAPLPPASGDGGAGGSGTNRAEMERRFENYKQDLVRPFFGQFLSKIDRQVVLVDPLHSLNIGRESLVGLDETMDDILRAFNPETNWLLGWLTQFWFSGIERTLYVGTKSDRLHARQHSNYADLVHLMSEDQKLGESRSGKRIAATTVSALNCTIGETRTHDGIPLGFVRGWTPGGDKQVSHFPGALPDDVSTLFDDSADWPEFDFRDFGPKRLPSPSGHSVRHINMDRVLQFLIGDQL